MIISYETLEFLDLKDLIQQYNNLTPSNKVSTKYLTGIRTVIRFENNEFSITNEEY